MIEKFQQRVEPMTVVIPTRDIFTDAGKHPAGVPWQVTERHAAVLFASGEATPWQPPPAPKAESVKEIIPTEKPSKGGKE